MSPSGCGARSAARNKARSELFLQVSRAATRRYRSKDGDDDVGPCGGAARFDSYVARRRRFPRLISASIGIRGAHVSDGPSGMRTNVGLPGTSLSYT
jgi:hypothetical protein